MKKKTDQIQFLKEAKNSFRWSYWGGGNFICKSDTYTRKSTAVTGAERFARRLKRKPVIVK